MKFYCSILLLSITLPACQPTPALSPAEATTPAMTQAEPPPPTVAPTRTPKPPTATPAPSPAPTMTAYAPSALPHEWPLPPLTEQQIAEVRACEFELLVTRRYPESLAQEALPDAFQPHSACDWAVLALAYSRELAEADRGWPEPARHAFSQAVSENPAFILAYPLFYHYLGAVELVAAPPVSRQPITHVRIDYRWDGHHEEQSPIAYTVEIENADHRPAVTVIESTSPEHRPVETVDRQLVQDLGNVLNDLVPVPDPLPIVICSDNYPDWSMTLDFADGTRLDLHTNYSNVLLAGGPWFVEIDDQHYLQASPYLTMQVGLLIEELDLPLGEPAGMTCYWQDIIAVAFPE